MITLSAVLAGTADARAWEKQELARVRYDLDKPVHGKGGWELAKYEWREDGTGRFLYVRNTGERREVIRTQTKWSV